MIGRCDACKWWVHGGEPVGELEGNLTMGECRYNPPTAYITGTVWSSGWPRVEPSSGCRKWEGEEDAKVEVRR